MSAALPAAFMFASLPCTCFSTTGVAKKGLKEGRELGEDGDLFLSFAHHVAAHMPLAVMWRRGIKAPARVVDDYVSFVDFAATLIDLAGLKWSVTRMQPTSGHSLTDILFHDRAGRAVKTIRARLACSSSRLRRVSGRATSRWRTGAP